MSEQKTILLSGGSGLLGNVLLSLDTSIFAPPRSEMDVSDMGDVVAWIEKVRPSIFIHAAAFTSPPRIDANPAQAVASNIIGTSNVVLACMKENIRLVYLSTDYVFRGDKGMYKEEDEVYPQNKYAWSKLGGECAVRLYDNALIVRTSFIADVFPYEKAFVDQYTSRDAISVIAPMVLKLARSDERGVIHIGTDRKSVFELAKRLKPDVGELRRNEVSFATPADTSLDLRRFKSLGF